MHTHSGISCSSRFHLICHSLRFRLERILPTAKHFFRQKVVKSVLLNLATAAFALLMHNTKQFKVQGRETPTKDIVSSIAKTNCKSTSDQVVQKTYVQAQNALFCFNSCIPFSEKADNELHQGQHRAVLQTEDTGQESTSSRRVQRKGASSSVSIRKSRSRAASERSFTSENRQELTTPTDLARPTT